MMNSVNNPEISIIVPVYNTENFLDECLLSIEDSLVFSISEVILIDDGSKDGSGQIMDRHAALYPNIHSLHFENGGISVARNHGMKLAKGKYIFFMDSDDTVEKDYIEKLYQRAIETGSDIVYAGFTHWNRDGSYVLVKEDILHQLKDNIISGTEYLRLRMNMRDNRNEVWNALYRSEYLKENHLMFNEDISIHEDVLFSILVLLKNAKVSGIMDFGYQYRFRPGSLARSGRSMRAVLALIDSVNILAKESEKMETEEINVLSLAILRNFELIAYVFGAAVHKDKGLTKKERKEIYRSLNNSNAWNLLKKTIHTKKDLLKYIIFRVRMDWFYLLTR